MRLTLVCAALALSLGCRDRTRAVEGVLAQASPPAGQPAQDAGSGSGATVIIEFPPPPVDALGVDYGAPLWINPSAPPGAAGNGKPVPRRVEHPPDALLAP
jgi:hypothetical protein